jgi:hypothetical protein
MLQAQNVAAVPALFSHSLGRQLSLSTRGHHLTAALRIDVALRFTSETILRRPSRKTSVKTYDIEVQRLKSAKLDKGMIELGVDASVLPRPARDDESSTSSLRLPVDHARSLLILLKQQLAEVDKLQPRSRRSGRS